MFQLILQAQGEGNPASMFLMFGVIAVFYVFFILLPQRKRSKEQKNFFSAIKAGDNVVTIGGMHGKIISLDETTVLLEIDKNVRVRVEKAALDSSRVNPNSEKAAGKTEKAEA